MIIQDLISTLFASAVLILVILGLYRIKRILRNHLRQCPLSCKN